MTALFRLCIEVSRERLILRLIVLVKPVRSSPRPHQQRRKDKTMDENAGILIHNLDDIARDYDGYEYGLPCIDDESFGKMLEAVKKYETAEISRLRQQVTRLRDQLKVCRSEFNVSLENQIYGEIAEDIALLLKETE